MKVIVSQTPEEARLTAAMARFPDPLSDYYANSLSDNWDHDNMLWTPASREIRDRQS